MKLCVRYKYKTISRHFEQKVGENFDENQRFYSKNKIWGNRIFVETFKIKYFEAYTQLCLKLYMSRFFFAELIFWCFHNTFVKPDYFKIGVIADKKHIHLNQRKFCTGLTIFSNFEPQFKSELCSSSIEVWNFYRTNFLRKSISSFLLEITLTKT